MSFKIADLYTDLRVSGYTTSARQLEQYKRHMENINSVASKTAMSLQSMFLVGGAGLGGASFVRMLANLESGFTEIRKTTDLTDQEFKQLQQTLMGMGNTMPVSISGLQEIAAVAGQLGIQGVDNIVAFTDTMAKLAATSSLTAEEAANSTAVILNQFGLAATEANRVGSVLTKLAATSVAAERDILDITTRIAGSAKTLGLTVDQAQALAAALKDAGVSNEVAGTSITNLFTKIIAESDKVAEAIGMTSEEFKKMVSDEPVKAVQEIINRLAVLEKEGRVEVLKDIGMDGARGTATMLQLANASKKFADHIKTASKEFENPLALEKEFNVQLEDTNKQFVIMLNKLTDIGAKLAENTGLASTFKDYLMAANDALGFFGEWKPWGKGGAMVPVETRAGQEALRGQMLEAEGKRVLERIMNAPSEEQEGFNAIAEEERRAAEQAEKDIADRRIRAMNEGVQQFYRNIVPTLKEETSKIANQFQMFNKNAWKQAEEWGKKNQARRDRNQDFANQIASQFLGQDQEFRSQFQGVDELHKQIQLAAVSPKKSIEELAKQAIEKMNKQNKVMEEVKKLIEEGNLIIPAVG